MSIIPQLKKKEFAIWCEGTLGFWFGAFSSPAGLLNPLGRRCFHLSNGDQNRLLKLIVKRKCDNKSNVLSK